MWSAGAPTTTREARMLPRPLLPDVTKCLGSKTWGANNYELGKFNLADTVTLSRSVFRVIRSLDRMGTDATARTCEKDGLSMREPLAAQA